MGETFTERKRQMQVKVKRCAWEKSEIVQWGASRGRNALRDGRGEKVQEKRGKRKKKPEQCSRKDRPKGSKKTKPSRNGRPQGKRKKKKKFQIMERGKKRENQHPS